MSLDALSAQITLFLTSETPEILGITGEWGVGKTYQWRKLSERINSAGEIKTRRSSYVSLFGVSSLADIRASTYANLRENRRLSPDSLSSEFFEQTIGRIIATVRKSVRFFKIIPQLRFIDAEAAFSGLASSMSGATIILDDLERRGEKLSLNEVFGFAASLRDQGCKVAIISNYERLSESDRSTFDQNAEKIFDRRVMFSLTPYECANIVFDRSNNIERISAQYAERLNISNVRILFRLKNEIYNVLKLALPKTESGLDEFLKNAVLIGYARLCPDRTLETFLFGKRTSVMYGIVKGDAITDNERKANDLLDQYNFGIVSDMESALNSYFVSGFDATGSIHQSVSKFERDNEKKLDGTTLRGAWNTYHYSLDPDPSDFRDRLMSAFETDIASVSLGDLNSSYKIMKEVGEIDAASSILEMYINQTPSSRDKFDLRDYSFAGDVNDPEILAALSKKFSEFVDQRDPLQVLIAMSKGYDDDDVIFVSKLTADNFYEIFKLAGMEQRNVIKTACRMHDLRADGRRISEVAMEAARRIADESPLNKMRISSMVRI